MYIVIAVLIGLGGGQTRADSNSPVERICILALEPTTAERLLCTFCRTTLHRPRIEDLIRDNQQAPFIDARNSASTTYTSPVCVIGVNEVGVFN